MKHLTALRERAARIDADFEKRERRAEMTLRSIQYLDRRHASERLLDFRESAPAPVVCACLDPISQARPR